MNKSSLKVLAASILTTVVLASCSSGDVTMKDGTYKAQFDSADTHGWTDYVEVTVQDGKISSAVYDALNEQGMKKTEDANYQESMEPVSGTYPSKYSSELSTQLVEKQDSEKVDIIAGATDSSNSFKKLIKDLEKNIKSGKTDTLNVAR